MVNKSEHGLPKQAGFGVGTLVVIIALVLIIGGYMYYSNQNAVPATPENVEIQTVVEASLPTDQMEDGTLAPEATPTATQ